MEKITTSDGEQKPVSASLLLASSPHINSKVNSQKLMGNVLIALAPICVFSVIMFGLPVLLNIVVAVAAAIAGESLFRVVIRQPARVKDLSAVVTGVMLALIIPPSLPLWMTALGSVFAIVVAKEFFGGLGANVFNPALIGRAFLLMSFPKNMGTWHYPEVFENLEAIFPTALTDATSSASPLGVGWVLPDQYMEMFLGFREGSSGETSILLLLVAFVFLLITKTIDWRAPVSMILSAAAFAFILGNDPVAAVLCGGLVFGAVFMTTDYVTSPLTPSGKVIFGIGAGIMTMLIRKYGMYPEGVCYSILIMNGITPFLNKILPRKYGFVPKKPAPKADAGSKGGAQ